MSRYHDWKHEKENEKFYGVTVPWQDPQTPTPQPQAVAPVPRFELGVEPVQDFLPEDFVSDVSQNSEVNEELLDTWGVELPPLPADASEHEKQLRTWALQSAKERRGGAEIDPAYLPRISGQAANEQWAVETKQSREGSEVPAIRRPSNLALREGELKDVRCPSCGLEFSAEIKS